MDQNFNSNIFAIICFVGLRKMNEHKGACICFASWCYGSTLALLLNICSSCNKIGTTQKEYYGCLVCHNGNIVLLN